MDGGASWDAVNSGLPPSSGIESLAIDPQNPSTVYAVIVQLATPASNGRARLLKSMDGGASWDAVNSGLPDTSIRTLAISRQDPSTVYVTSGGGTFAITFVP
jgi:hypothetical protein